MDSKKRIIIPNKGDIIRWNGTFDEKKGKETGKATVIDFIPFNSMESPYLKLQAVDHESGRLMKFHVLDTEDLTYQQNSWELV